jgi:hypothetical protein
MASKETAGPKDTTSYVDLSSQSYSLFVDAYASANKRALDYSKSFWEIASRPYSTAAIEAAVQDNFDRANKLVSLTIAEMQTNGQKAAEFAEQFAAYAAKLQESYTASLKGLLDTGLSNLNYVKDTATQQFEELAKRADEIQKTAVAKASSNN